MKSGEVKGLEKFLCQEWLYKTGGGPVSGTLPFSNSFSRRR